MRNRVVTLAAIAFAIAPLVTPATSTARAAAPSSPFAKCHAPGARIRVGHVSCQRERSRDLGGTTAFSYFVPRGCAPRLHRRCPTLYLLHGFGGDFESMLGTRKDPSAWVTALSRRPRVAPQRSAHVWTEADTADWVRAKHRDVVLIAPDGRTVPGGDGPEPLLESFWTDWNPRYAKGGSDPAYRTPPPRFAAYVRHELVHDVQAWFPVGAGRSYRALSGTSLGGYGSYAIGLTYPDGWASLGAVSGIMNILLVHGLDPQPGGTPSLPIVPSTKLTVPAPGGGRVPLHLLPSQARGFAAATFAFGDPSADGAYYRGRMPVDLALNAHARRHGVQSVAIRGISNDTVSRVPAEATSFPGFEVAQAFEDLVFVTNQEMNRSFRSQRVRQHYELHPGIHSDTYWNPWLRQQISAQYRALRHWDGSGSPPRRPRRFDDRSTSKHFSVWGWRIRVRRPAIEFLSLRRVTCAGFTIHGSGHAIVTVPRRCHRGVHGSRRVRVNLGPSQPADAPAGADSSSSYGRTVHVHLRPL
jgi:S-formylglutathione hydrolase FrmB